MAASDASINRELAALRRGFNLAAFLSISRHSSGARTSRAGGSGAKLRSMLWSQVDFNPETIRLEPGTTKKQEGRTFYMTLELRELPLGQWNWTRETSTKDR
jgi:integrase